MLLARNKIIIRLHYSSISSFVLGCNRQEPQPKVKEFIEQIIHGDP